MNLLGLKIILDSNLSDYDSVKRTWKERLLSTPWRPWVSHKSVYAPKAYHTGDTVICSPRSYQQLRDVPKETVYPGYYCPKLDLAYDDVHDFDR